MSNDDILQIARVLRSLREVFTTVQAEDEWLNTPDPFLDYKTPLEMLTSGGGDKVENLAAAMARGVPLFSSKCASKSAEEISADIIGRGHGNFQ